ncbi:hypothetical protein QW131_24320 [Roseibium salinum]|nr:hypothetical protein [Roseibium salinum]
MAELDDDFAVIAGFSRKGIGGQGKGCCGCRSNYEFFSLDVLPDISV